MNAMNRSGMLAALAVLSICAGDVAQIPGMPLFTNPRFATGIRVHADYGRPTSTDSAAGDLSVVQGGLGIVLGPIGIDANVGALRSDVKGLQACQANPNTASCNANSKVTASALLQLHLLGGARSNLRLSLFGGGSADVTAYDVIDCTGVTPVSAFNQCQSYRDQHSAKQLTIPVGAAVGVRIPLGVASLNLWGAPRMNLIKFVGCAAGNTTCAAKMQSNFRWAVGADFPIFRSCRSARPTTAARKARPASPGRRARGASARASALAECVRR